MEGPLKRLRAQVCARGAKVSSAGGRARRASRVRHDRARRDGAALRARELFVFRRLRRRRGRRRLGRSGPRGRHSRGRRVKKHRVATHADLTTNPSELVSKVHTVQRRTLVFSRKRERAYAPFPTRTSALPVFPGTGPSRSRSTPSNRTSRSPDSMPRPSARTRRLGDDIASFETLRASFKARTARPLCQA